MKSNESKECSKSAKRVRGFFLQFEGNVYTKKNGREEIVFTELLR